MAWLSAQVPRLCSELPETRQRSLHSLLSRLRAGVLAPAELAAHAGEVGTAVGFLLLSEAAQAPVCCEALEVLSRLSAAPEGARVLALADVPACLQRYLDSPAAAAPAAAGAAAAATALLGSLRGAARLGEPGAPPVQQQQQQQHNPWAAAEEGGGASGAASHTARMRAAAAELAASFRGLTLAGTHLVSAGGAAAASQPPPPPPPQPQPQQRQPLPPPSGAAPPYAFPTLALTQGDEDALASLVSAFLPAREGVWSAACLPALDYLCTSILPHLPAEALLDCPALLDVLLSGLSLRRRRQRPRPTPRPTTQCSTLWWLPCWRWCGTWRRRCACACCPAWWVQPPQAPGAVAGAASATFYAPAATPTATATPTPAPAAASLYSTFSSSLLADSQPQALSPCGTRRRSLAPPSFASLAASLAGAPGAAPAAPTAAPRTLPAAL